MAGALYEPRPDGAFVPTTLTRGPWTPEAQHGGPPAALLAGAFEVAEPRDMFVARFTMEFLRPVPVIPLTVAARVTRPGRRVQLVEGDLAAGGEVVARATALRIRRHDGLDLPEGASGPPASLPPPEEATLLRLVPVAYENLGDALETRSVVGGLTEPGPSTTWIRLTVPVVADTPPSPLQRVLVAADCGNGVSSAVELGRWLFINPDLTLYQHRDLEGQWVGLDAVSRLEPQGTGLAEAALYDRTGRFGRSLQSLYVDGAGALPPGARFTPPGR